MKVTTTITTCRQLENLEAWAETDLINSHLIVVEDSAKRTVKIPSEYDYTYYNWNDIDKEMGANAWIISRQADALRSFSFLKAHDDNPSMVVALDDDCYPITLFSENFVKQHKEVLKKKVDISQWVSPIHGLYTRGIPFCERKLSEVVMSQGCWTGGIDLDGIGHLTQDTSHISIMHYLNEPLRKGIYMPICSMHNAFKPKIIPAYYQLIMGLNKHGIDRFADIWSGLFLKRVCDHLDKAIFATNISIEHRQNPNPFRNVKREIEGMEVHEKLYKYVMDMPLEGTTFKECYVELADKLPELTPHLTKMKSAMKVWGDYFD